MNNASLKTKIVAGVLSTITLVSAATATTSTAFAATHTSELSVSAELQGSSNGIITDLAGKILKSAAESLLGMLKDKGIDAVVNSDVGKAVFSLLGIDPAVKLSDLSKALNEVSKRMDSYHTEEMKMLRNIMSEGKLNIIYDKLDEIRVKNSEALKEIANAEGSRATAKMQIIKKSTIDDSDFKTDLQKLNGYFSPNSLTDNKSVLQYCFDYLINNNIDASVAKEQVKAIAKTFMDQYTFAFDSFIVGYKASAQIKLNEYNVASKKGDKEEINKAKRAWELEKSVSNSCIKSLIENAKDVKEQYDKFIEYVENAEQAYVTIDGKTTQFASFADAWYHVNAQNKDASIKLNKDINLDSIKSKFVYYKDHTDRNKYFGDNNIKVLYSDKEIVIDLNGHNLTNSGGNEAIDAADGFKVTIVNSNPKDRDGNRQGIIGGIKLDVDSKFRTGKASINDVIISGGGSTGVHCYNDNKLSGGSQVILRNCIVKGYSNSGVYLYLTEFTALNTIFDSNSSNNGGAIRKGYEYLDQIDLNLISCVFTNNHANEDGGAIYYSGKTLKVDGCTFKNNSAGSTGGAIYTSCSRCGTFLEMHDTTITNNTAGKNAGGVYCDLDNRNNTSCDPCIGGKMTITNNTANGRTSNVFLKENTLTKAILVVDEDRPVTSDSRIGITSDTDDKTLDVVKCKDKNSYKLAANVFSYDTGKYHINAYSHWYNKYWWYEIVKN